MTPKVTCTHFKRF